jgi:hypothetical protein
MTSGHRQTSELTDVISREVVRFFFILKADQEIIESTAGTGKSNPLKKYLLL